MSNVIKLIEEIIPADAVQITDEQVRLLKQFSPELWEEARRLRKYRASADHAPEIDEKMSSLSSIANFLPVYVDMATFCQDNRFQHVINISPHFMYASPIFRRRTNILSYEETYPLRFGDKSNVVKTFMRGWRYNENDMVSGRYMSFCFNDDFGRVDMRFDKTLVVSADTLGWPGVLEHAGLESWDQTYKNLYDTAREVLAYMPKLSKPTYSEYPGQVITSFEHYNAALGIECGLYLLTPVEKAAHFYVEDIEKFKDGLNK